MKGFIKKDFLLIRTLLPVLVILLILAVWIAGLLGTTGAPIVGILPGIMTAMLCMLTLLTGMSFAGRDEQCGWDSFAAALPVSRRQIVLARYATDLLLLLIALTLLLAVQILSLLLDGGFSPVYDAVLAAVSLSVMGIMTPLIYRFGAQIGSYIFTGFSMLLGVGVPLLTQGLGGNMTDEQIDAMVENALRTGVFLRAAVIAVAASALLYALSALLSVRIYQKKQF